MSFPPPNEVIYRFERVDPNKPGEYRLVGAREGTREKKRIKRLGYALLNDADFIHYQHPHKHVLQRLAKKSEQPLKLVALVPIEELE